MPNKQKEIEKLIKEYNKKIELCDKTLSSILISVRAERAKGNKDQDFLNDLKCERIHSSAQRQCYVQIISELTWLPED